MGVSTPEHIIQLDLQNSEIDFIKFYLYFSSIDDQTAVQRRWYLLTSQKSVNEVYEVIMHDVTEKMKNKKDG